MVDVDGAYTRRQALCWAERFPEYGAGLEEPVTSEDTEGIRLLRDRGPAGMVVMVDEYTWNLTYANEMIERSLRSFSR